MKKIMWFSRHEMTALQKADLEKIYGVAFQIHQVNKTIKSAYELKDDLAECDILAVVMPLNLQEQMLKIAGEKPVLICRNHRVEIEPGKFEFIHAGWEQIHNIEIVKTILSEIPAPEKTFRK